MSDQKRIDDLEVGDYVREGYNSKRQLLVSDFPIHDEEDLDRLREIGVERCRVEDGGADTDTETEATDEATSTDDETKSKVVDRARSTYRETLENMENLVQRIHDNRNRASELAQLKPLVEDLLDYVRISPESVSCLTQIQQFDDFVYHHSVNVSILALLYGHAEGFEHDLLLKFGFGALVHDIGKTKLSRRILQQDRKLTDKERTIVETHPEKGREILQTAGFGSTIRKIALQHHLRPDGSGYPSDTGEIQPLARIVSVIDAYEEVLAVGPNRNRPHPVDAYNKLKDEFYDHQDTRNVLENIIQIMGLYPVGCLVELSTDDIAVVVENQIDHLQHPKVSVVGSEEHGALAEPYDIDLEHTQHQKRAVEGKIYDDGTRIERVLNYQDVPQLRRKVPGLITDYHAA